MWCIIRNKRHEDRSARRQATGNHSLISAVERQCMSCEIDDILTKVKASVDFTHGSDVRIHSLQGLGIILIEVCHKHQELAEASFLKHAHEICERMRVRGGMVKGKLKS